MNSRSWAQVFFSRAFVPAVSILTHACFVFFLLSTAGGAQEKNEEYLSIAMSIVAKLRHDEVSKVIEKWMEGWKRGVSRTRL